MLTINFFIKLYWLWWFLTENGNSMEIHRDEWTAVGDYSRSRWTELGSVDSSDRSSYLLHKSFELRPYPRKYFFVLITDLKKNFIKIKQLNIRINYHRP